MSAEMLRGAGPARGDLAFVAAFTAYGQKLRGDPLPGRLLWPQIGALRAGQRDYWPQEFGKLVRLAGRSGGARGE